MMNASGISRAVDAPTVARRAHAARCTTSKSNSDIHDVWTSCAGLRTQGGLPYGGTNGVPSSMAYHTVSEAICSNQWNPLRDQNGGSTTSRSSKVRVTTDGICAVTGSPRRADGRLNNG